MSTSTTPRTKTPASATSQSLAALALADARRFARHPLFLLGVAALLAVFVSGIAQRQVDPSPLETTILPAFYLGVFGFVVAHRLTTSLRRTGDLADTTPVGRQRRTLALCLACLVPMSAGIVTLVGMLVYNAVLPPDGNLVGQPVAWFGDEPDIEIMAALVATVPVAALGGPLLGVAVAKWVPFRGSALVGMVVLAYGVAYLDGLTPPWVAASPYFIFSESLYVDGQVRSSWLVDGVSPIWYCAYTLSLCGLAVVAALLHDDANRRPLLRAAAAIAVVAAASLLLAVT